MAKGTVAQNAASNTSPMAKASRVWPRLGGSVDSRTCCPSKRRGVVVAAASARDWPWGAA